MFVSGFRNLIWQTMFVDLHSASLVPFWRLPIEANWYLSREWLGRQGRLHLGLAIGSWRVDVRYAVRGRGVTSWIDGSAAAPHSGVLDAVRARIDELLLEWERRTTGHRDAGTSAAAGGRLPGGQHHGARLSGRAAAGAGRGACRCRGGMENARVMPPQRRGSRRERREGVDRPRAAERGDSAGFAADGR